MPLGLPAAGVLRNPANFEVPLKEFVDGNEMAAIAAKARADEAHTLAASKYSKPAGGIPATDLVTSGLVKTDGSLLLGRVLTQAAYDALPTAEKNAITSMLVIVG